VHANNTSREALGWLLTEKSFQTALKNWKCTFINCFKLIKVHFSKVSSSISSLPIDILLKRENNDIADPYQIYPRFQLQKSGKLLHI
jgi:hypothetical protein